MHAVNCLADVVNDLILIKIQCDLYFMVIGLFIISYTFVSICTTSGVNELGCHYD